MIPISKRSKQLETWLKEFTQASKHAQEAILNRYQVDPVQLLIIEFIAIPDQVNMTELGKEFNIKLSTLTFAIDRLEKKKLVKRKPSPKDRRVVYVQLSPKGNRLLEELTSINRNLAKDLISSSPTKELENLIQSLERILSMIRE